MIPEPSSSPGRVDNPDTPSAPLTYKDRCPSCYHSTTGTSNGLRTWFCLLLLILEAHQKKEQLIFPPRFLQVPIAFNNYCQGRYHTTVACDFHLPVIHHRPAPRTTPRQNLSTRVCLHCKRSYAPKSPNSNYCSPECSKAARAAREKVRRAAKRAGDHA
ncbi:MAG: hypothetical protein A4E38_00002 [Methanoregulaceae archaeon PtaB.Bin108]|nr:MAG: hypothetical protein A4E38_00002 [Methanoregulaceae archaeon PtaB.Bin108]